MSFSLVEHPQHQGVEHRQENDVGDLLVPQGQKGAQQHQQGQAVEDQGVVDPHKAGRRHGQSGEPRHHEAVGQGHPVYRNTAQYAAEHHIEQRQETIALLHSESPSVVRGCAVSPHRRGYLNSTQKARCPEKILRFAWCPTHCLTAEKILRFAWCPTHCLTGAGSGPPP